MSATDIQVITIIVPNPQYDNSRSAKVVENNLGFGLIVNDNFQTLSNTNPNNYDTIEGLLYVPTLTNDTIGNVCADVQDVIPSNVTTLASFSPDANYPLTAIFPWSTNDNCNEAFFAQARADAVRDVITFQPQTSTTPAVSDPSWNMRQNVVWKSDNQFPIYAIDGVTGGVLLYNLAQYSGNMTQAPFGPQLADQYNSRDFPRLFAHVDLQGTASVPSLWIFLIIVLAILLGIVILASLTMHLIQRHQRRALQRRVQRGEVDLESLGIKRMNVPQDQIDKMPRYVYSDSAAPAPPAIVSGKSALKAQAQSQAHSASFSQTTCAVCLDDFASGETEVRELPCKHIYHPECIDLFLRDSSSLCPICKQSALPAGYCPVKVTNLMVRRERLVRRMRERRQRASDAEAIQNGSQTPAPPTSRMQALLQRAARMGRNQPQSSSTQINAPATASASNATNQTPVAGVSSNGTSSVNRTNNQAEAVELRRLDAQIQHRHTNAGSTARRETMTVPADIASQGASARRAWRRERLARMEEEAYNEQAETARNADVGRPLWRRVAGRFIPSLE